MANQVIERIFEYDNYRFFIKDYFCEQKRQRDIFSHRFFALRAGFSSSSFCAHVIEGKRNLTAESMRKMIKGLGLTGKSAAFFEALVHYNQAKTLEDRHTYLTRMEHLRKTTSFYKINKDQYAFYDEWYYPVIRELAVYADWHDDYAVLAKMVKPAITPEKARGAIETLVRCGLLVKVANNRYVQPADVVTATDVPWNLTRKSRKKYILMAIDAMETMQIDSRHIAGATVAMSEKRYRAIVEHLDEIRKEILESAVEETDVQGVYQFNFQAFPLSAIVPRSQKKLPGGSA